MASINAIRCGRLTMTPSSRAEPSRAEPSCKRNPISQKDGHKSKQLETRRNKKKEREKVSKRNLLPLFLVVSSGEIRFHGWKVRLWRTDPVNPRSPAGRRQQTIVHYRRDLWRPQWQLETVVGNGERRGAGLFFLFIPARHNFTFESVSEHDQMMSVSSWKLIVNRH